MARYHMYSPNPVWFDLAGVANTPNGSIQFYEIGTTTPKATYNAFSAGSVNANPVPMDSSGRLNVDVWLDGDYSIVVYDEDDAVIDTFDMRPAADAAQSITVPNPNEFVSGDGAQFLNVDLTSSLLPDPTGLVGYTVVSDGEAWIATAPAEEPEPVDPEIVVTAATVLTGLRVGSSDDETKANFLLGTVTVSASGTKTATASVTFSTPFSTVPKIFPVNVTGFITATGDVMPTVAITAKSTTGFTVRLCTQIGEANGDADIDTACDIDWVAIGTLEVPA